MIPLCIILEPCNVCQVFTFRGTELLKYFIFNSFMFLIHYSIDPLDYLLLPIVTTMIQCEYM